MPNRAFVPVPSHSLLASLASCALYIRKSDHVASTTHSLAELDLPLYLSNEQASRNLLPPTALDLSLFTQLASIAVVVRVIQRTQGSYNTKTKASTNLRHDEWTLSLGPTQRLRAIRSHELILIGLCSRRIYLRALSLLIVMHVPVPFLRGISPSGLHDSLYPEYFG